MNAGTTATISPNPIVVAPAQTIPIFGSSFPANTIISVYVSGNSLSSSFVANITTDINGNFTYILTGPSYLGDYVLTGKWLEGQMSVNLYVIGTQGSVKCGTATCDIQSNVTVGRVVFTANSLTWQSNGTSGSTGAWNMSFPKMFKPNKVTINGISVPFTETSTASSYTISFKWLFDPPASPQTMQNPPDPTASGEVIWPVSIEPLLAIIIVIITAPIALAESRHLRRRSMPKMAPLP